MDNRSDKPTQTTDAGAFKACCTSAPQAEPAAEKKARPADDKKPEKAGKGGCCCSGH